MRIAILSRLVDCYSTRRIAEEAGQRGHQVRVIVPDQCYLRIEANQAAVYCKGELLKHFDAVIPRFGSSLNYYGTTVLRQFEMMNTHALNNAEAIALARDKVRTLQVLAQHGVAVPVTCFGHDQGDNADQLALAGSLPVVIKLVEGMKGMGVMLAESRTAALSVIESLQGLKAQVMVQEFIREAEGRDLRCLVVGGKLVAAMQRRARAGEFRANLDRGGTAEPVLLTDEERALALRAAKLIGLQVAGVDILRSRRGPLVLEVNASPGLKGIEAVSGLNIAGCIIDQLEHELLQRESNAIIINK